MHDTISNATVKSKIAVKTESDHTLFRNCCNQPVRTNLLVSKFHFIASLFKAKHPNFQNILMYLHRWWVYIQQWSVKTPALFCFVLLKNDSMVWGERERKGAEEEEWCRNRKKTSCPESPPPFYTPEPQKHIKTPLVFCGRNDELKARNMFRQL